MVWTTSDAESDIVQSYALGAPCDVTKPGDLAAYQTVMRWIKQFWLTVAKLP